MIMSLGIHIGKIPTVISLKLIQNPTKKIFCMMVQVEESYTIL